MLTERKELPFMIHAEFAWTDPTPPSLDCFLSHFDELAEHYGALANECREFASELRGRITRGRKPTKAQFQRAIRIGCQLGSEDVSSHPNPPQPLVDLGRAADKLYFDAIRLAGEQVWDEIAQTWAAPDEIAKRKAGTWGPTASIAEPAKADPLADAVAIARSAALEDIDWSREPLTEREAAARKRWLQKKLEMPNDDGHVAIRMVDLVLTLRGHHAASDLKEAYETINRRQNQELQRRERAEFEEIATELDGEVAS
jgi:hypothetical protein